MKTPDIFDLYTDYLITSFSHTPTLLICAFPLTLVPDSNVLGLIPMLINCLTIYEYGRLILSATTPHFWQPDKTEIGHLKQYNFQWLP
jgi:hypothetical protein